MPSSDNDLPLTREEFSRVTRVEGGGYAYDDRLAPDINSEGGVELLDNEDGWVIGVRGHRLMRFPTEKHMVTIGDIGEGKGTSVAIPNLLVHEGSAFSLEMAGTTYRETVNWRRHVLKQKVYVIDPWGATGEESDCINLLDTLDPESLSFFGQSKAFASTLMKNVDGKKDAGSAGSDYFEDNAHKLLTAILIYIKTSEDVEDDERNLPYLLKVCAGYGAEEWHDLMDKFILDTGRHSDLLNSVGNYFRGQDSENVRSIFSSMDKKFMDIMDPAIKKIVSRSTFSLSDLKDGNTTVYVIFREAQDMSSSPAFIRLLVERTIAAYPNLGDGGKGYKATKNRLLMLLDEFTQMGRIDGIDKHMTTVRQKGVTIWPIFHNIGQLIDVYGEHVAHTILSSAGVVQVLRVAEPTTLKYVSEKMGKRIVLIPHVQHGSNWGETDQRNWSRTDATGVSDVISEGTSDSKSETWNDTDTTGQSTNTGHSRTRGVSNTTGISDSHTDGISNNMGYSFSTYTGFTPKDNAKVRDINSRSGNGRDATSAGYTTTVNNGISSSSSHTYATQSSTSVSDSDSYTEGNGRFSSRSRTVGESRQVGRNHSTSVGMNESTARQEGESAGSSRGGSYSITYTPQILPVMEPWQIEDVLTGDRQILLVRAKNKNMRLVDTRAHFFNIPALLQRTIGPRIIPAPMMLGALIPPLSLEYLPSRNLDIKISDMVEVDVCVYEPRTFDAFDVPEKKFSIGKTGMEKYLDARWLHANSESDQTKKEKNSRFIDVAQDMQTRSLKMSAERDQQEINLNAQWERARKYGSDIEEQRNILLSARGYLDQKLDKIRSMESILTEYRINLIEDLCSEEQYKSSIQKYNDYVSYVHNLRNGWVDFDVPDRPDDLPVISTGDWKDEDLQDFINLSIPPFSMSIPNILSPISEQERERAPEIKDPLPMKDILSIQADIGGGVHISFSELNEFLSDKNKMVQNLYQRGDQRRAQYLDRLSLRVAEEAKNTIIDIVEKDTFNALSGLPDLHEKFSAWQAFDSKQLSQYIRDIRIHRRDIRKIADNMKCVNAAMDDHWERLQKHMDQLNYANMILQSRRHNLHNDMCNWSIWGVLENQNKNRKLIEKSREELNSEHMPRAVNDNGDAPASKFESFNQMEMSQRGRDLKP